MSKILVIQPYRMLQQAIALYLFPEHAVQMAEAVPESVAANDFDAVIVDAASLQETRGLALQAVRAVQNWKDLQYGLRVATVSAPKQKLVLMKTPIAREVLQSSLAECLGISTGAKRNGTASAPDQDSRDSIKGTANEKRDIAASAAQNAKIIELVDVVEEGPGRKASRGQQK
jgi:hypothetical protein